MEYKIWNKKENINGVDASIVLTRHNIKEEDEIFLILSGNRVVELQFKDVIKNTYNIVSDDVEEVAKEYIKIKEEEKFQAVKETLSLEEQSKRISALEQENKALREELNQMQNSINLLVAKL